MKMFNKITIALFLGCSFVSTSIADSDETTLPKMWGKGGKMEEAQRERDKEEERELRREQREELRRLQRERFSNN